ncbi:MAG: pantetheine-phosphate adenylyltransferase [Gemmatimonadetes bacterium]|nr:pantetheine-phosphate adenylyltransferase [Gemmatimonadota bacterium]MYD27005.1 pantetheine-phosphate adenylyltransferase [Gemmatimonadota bacterium]MYI98868.1 pantetheine-phosphate adenylyltransferase [Gemmatimonadota bacterium]
MKVAVYPGTFDPVTNGHLDVLRQALSVFDRVVVAVATNMEKHPMFSVEERVDLFRQAVDGWTGVEVMSSDGLTVELAGRLGAHAIVRGVRSAGDLETESQMALMNRRLAPSVTTVSFFPGEPSVYVSSSLVKEVFRFGGDVSHQVPPPVLKALSEKRGSTG